MASNAIPGKVTRLLLSFTNAGAKRELTARTGGVGDIIVRDQRRGLPVVRRGGAGAQVPGVFRTRSYGTTILSTPDNDEDFRDAAGQRAFHTYQEEGQGSGMPQNVGESFVGQWTIGGAHNGLVGYGITLVVDGPSEDTTPQ